MARQEGVLAKPRLEVVQQEIKGIKGDLHIAQDRSYADSLKKNASIDLKEGETQGIQQKRQMQGQVHEALKREKRRQNLVIMGIKEETEEERTKTVIDFMKVLGLEEAREVKVLGRIGKAGKTNKGQVGELGEQA